jgi:hypothetical protein
MDSDPVGKLLERAADGKLSATEADLELLQESATFLIEANSDRHRTRELLKTLERAARNGEGGAAMFGEVALQVLEALARALLVSDPAPASAPPRDTQRLASAVLAKKHAPEILRILASQGDSRPANLTQATGLADMKVHRVLTWAMVNGLLQRWATQSNVHYRLSPLGETVLEAIDEPQWVTMAATLVRIGVREQLRARDGQDWLVDGPSHPSVRRAAMLTGLSPEQAARGLNQFSHALQPAAVSSLAAALRYTPHAGVRPSREMIRTLAGGSADVDGKIIISPPVFHELFKSFDPPGNPSLVRRERLWAPRLDSLAESLVNRTVERSGIPALALREVLPHHYLRATKQARPYHLPIERPILAIGGPELNPVTAGLFFEYGVTVYLRHRPRPELVWQQGDKSLSFYPSGDDDYGLLLRIFDDRTGATHFVIGGLRPSGTYAACRSFYAEAEELLDAFPEQSFATVLRVPRSYARRKQRTVVVELQPVAVDTSTHRHGRLDMRYVEILPLLGAALQSRAQQRALQQHFSRTLQAADRKLDCATVEALAQGGWDEAAPLCRRVRDTALAYTLMDRFKDLVVLIAEGVLDEAPDERARPAAVLRERAGLSTFAAAAVVKLLSRRQTLGATHFPATAGQGTPAGR